MSYKVAHKKNADGSFDKVGHPGPVFIQNFNYPELPEDTQLVYSRLANISPLDTYFYADAVNGSDSNDGLSSETAVATVWQALKLMHKYSGRKILILAPGEYTEFTDDARWGLFEPLGLQYIAALDSNNWPIIKASYVDFVGISSLQLYNLEFIGPVRFKYSNVTVQNVKFSNSTIDTYTVEICRNSWIYIGECEFISGTKNSAVQVGESTVEMLSPNTIKRTVANGNQGAFRLSLGAKAWCPSFPTITDTSGIPVSLYSGSYMLTSGVAAPAGSIISQDSKWT